MVYLNLIMGRVFKHTRFDCGAYEDEIFMTIGLKLSAKILCTVRCALFIASCNLIPLLVCICEPPGFTALQDLV